MSRSFVRAWATVATIMAMVCFAFVQPMPEHVATAQKSAHSTEGAALRAPASDQLSATPPFVDSIITGKTFTPLLVISPLTLLRDAASRRFARPPQRDALRSPPHEPLIRPG
jgi:hypothetical protein